MRYIMMRYAAARRRRDSLPILVATTDGDTWYIEGVLRNEIRGEFHEQFDILKEYGEECDNSGDMYDKFLQDYPPRPCDISAIPDTFVVPEGWLSPEGKLFLCRNGEHYSFAYDLRVAFYGPDQSLTNADYLERRGWIHVGYSLVTFNYNVSTVSHAQIEALQTMKQIGASQEPYVKAIDNFFEMTEIDN